MENKTITMAAQYRYNKKQVLFLTGIEEDEYNHFICETAETWLRLNFDHRVDSMKMVGSLDFWRWFKMHWEDLDDRFFLQELYNQPESYRLCKYRILHQIIFDNTATVTQYLNDDFLDMFKTFKYESKV